MLGNVIVVCFSIFAIATFSAQDTTVSTGDAAAGSSNPASFIVQINEYRLNQPLDPSQTADELLNMLTQGNDIKNDLVESICLSTISGSASMVKFGRRVNVTVGTARTNRGAMVRNVQSFETGTMVKVTAALQSENVILNLEFESSRLLNREENSDSPPDIVTTQINTTQLLVLGKPRLVGSATSKTTSVVVITVTQN